MRLLHRRTTVFQDSTRRKSYKRIPGLQVGYTWRKTELNSAVAMSALLVTYLDLFLRVKRFSERRSRSLDIFAVSLSLSLLLFSFPPFSLICYLSLYLLSLSAVLSIYYCSFSLSISTPLTDPLLNSLSLLLSLSVCLALTLSLCHWLAPDSKLQLLCLFVQNSD